MNARKLMLMFTADEIDRISAISRQGGYSIEAFIVVAARKRLEADERLRAVIEAYDREDRARSSAPGSARK